MSYQTAAPVIDALAHSINEWARKKGFWQVPPTLQDLMVWNQEVKEYVTNLIKTQKAALVTTETSEQVEAIRKPGSPSGVEGFDNETEEVADQIIRLLDYAGHFNMPIGACIAAKMEKNEGRPFMHGKKF